MSGESSPQTSEPLQATQPKAATDVLYRCVEEHKYRRTDGCAQASAFSFHKKTGTLSTYAAAQATEEFTRNNYAEKCHKDPKDVGLATLSATEVEALGLKIDPTPDLDPPPNESHTDIVYPKAGAEMSEIELTNARGKMYGIARAFSPPPSHVGKIPVWPTGKKFVGEA